MKRLGIILIGFFALFSPLISIAYTSPGNPQGFVNDFADILTDDQEAKLESKLVQFEQESSNEIAIVTVESLGEETIEEYAVKLFEEWGIGKAKNDNGILLLVAVDSRQMRIEVGYGLEGAVPDIMAGEIIRDVLTPNFRRGYFYVGIDKAADAIFAATRGEYTLGQNAPINFDWLEPAFFIVALVLPWLGSILSRSKSWWGGGVFGAIGAVILGFIYGTSRIPALALILIPLGLLFDYIVSKTYTKYKAYQKRYPWWTGGGGGHGGHGGGGFGGFGGGSSGGGGASGRW